MVQPNKPAPNGSSTAPNSTKAGTRSLPTTSHPPPTPRPLGSFRSTQDTSTLAEVPPASIGAVPNRAKVPDVSAPSTSGGTTSMPSARPVLRKLNFKAKVIARTAAGSDVKPEAQPVPTASSSSLVGGARPAKGRGRGTAHIEATASGPFALGPSESRRFSRGAPVRFSTSSKDAAGVTGASGDSLDALSHPRLAGLDIASNSREEKEEEEYSDLEDSELGRVDVRDVGKLDWMAPEALRKTVRTDSRRNSVGIPKTERPASDTSKLYPELDSENTFNVSEIEDAAGEDIISSFTTRGEQEVINTKDSQLYFFQFPSPFPDFLPIPRPGRNDGDSASTSSASMGSNRRDVTVSTDTLLSTQSNAHSLKRPKTVTFAPETKAPMPITEVEPLVLDGVIGQLDIYRSGAVKMRLNNGSVLDVTMGTQPTFLQHAVHLELSKTEENRSGMTVLGGVSRRFVVSPDVEPLLKAMEVAEGKGKGKDRHESTRDPELMEVDGS